MRHHWQALLDLIWPSRYDPVATRERRIALLQAALVVAIALAAGPEVFAAMEMTAVLELLGAILFLTAMAAGARLVALTIWRTICRIALPAPQAALMQSNASTPAKAAALAYIAVHAAWYLILSLSLIRGRVGYSNWPHE
jgi:hypothetical protein